jgi:hypothetical protein
LAGRDTLARPISDGVVPARQVNVGHVLGRLEARTDGDGMRRTATQALGLGRKRARLDARGAVSLILRSGATVVSGPWARERRQGLGFRVVSNEFQPDRPNGGSGAAGGVIRTVELTKVYAGADFRAVDGLNLSVASGEIFGLLGPNGPGTKDG